jgi:hypothetical protein
MRGSEFLRRQAEQCVAMSRATIDLTVAGRLRAMAADFREMAAEWENDDRDHGRLPCNGGARRAD